MGLDSGTVSPYNPGDSRESGERKSALRVGYKIAEEYLIAYPYSIGETVLIVKVTAEGHRIATDLNEWPYLKIIELSVLGASLAGCESVTLFKVVKDLRHNPFLADEIIAKVIERLEYRGWLKIETC